MSKGETEATHEDKLGSIIKSNHYIRQRVQESVKEFLWLRQNLIQQLKAKELDNLSNDFVPLIDALKVETLNGKVTADKVQLVLCGENSSGKTSFIHLLLGIADILPADIGPITARIVKMTYAKDEEACAIIYPSLEESSDDKIGIKVDLAPFFVVKDEYGEPCWEKISEALDEHVRRPKGMDIKSTEFEKWAEAFVEIRIPSSTLKLGIDVYDTAGFRIRDAPILKKCLFDLVRIVQPTIVFLYENPSVTSEPYECFLELKNTLKHFDSSNIFFLNTKADIGNMDGIEEIETEEQFLTLLKAEQFKRYKLLLQVPGMANGLVGGLPKSLDKCHCFDICSVYSQQIAFGPIMNTRTIQRLIQFVANSDLIMAQRVCSIVLPAIEAFFDLNLITSHREPDQIKQLRLDALSWIELYFKIHRSAFEEFLRDIFTNISKRISDNETSIAHRAAQQVETSNIKIYVELSIQLEIMKGVVYDALGTLPKIISNIMQSNPGLTINSNCNEILVAVLRADIGDQPEILNEDSVNASILKAFMKQTFITPALMATDLLYNEENNAARSNLLLTARPRQSSITNLDPPSPNAIQEAQQHIKDIHTQIINSERMFNTTVFKWCSKVKEKLEQQITKQYDTSINLLPVRGRVHGILQQYAHQFVRIECQLQAAQDLAKFNGKKPSNPTSTTLNSGSTANIYRFDEIQWGSIQKNLFAKRLNNPIPGRPYTSYLEAHYHRKMTSLNIPNIIKLTYLHENQLSTGSYEMWMIFDMRSLNIKQNLKTFIDKHHRSENFISLKKNFQITLPIITALVGLHENELVHRNVQLTNILLNENDESFLADFGDSVVFENETSNDIEMRHFVSPTSDGRIGDIQAFGQVASCLSTIIDPKDLTLQSYKEYKLLIDRCLTEKMKATEIQYHLKFIYDRFSQFSK